MCEDWRERERVEKKIRAAKRAARSELSVTKGEWRKHGYAESGVLDIAGIEDALPRIDCRQMTREEFVERFESPCKPCVITGASDDWPATEHWQIEQLLEKYGSHR